jgi:hypothetical protein
MHFYQDFLFPSHRIDVIGLALLHLLTLLCYEKAKAGRQNNGAQG